MNVTNTTPLNHVLLIGAEVDAVRIGKIDEVLSFEGYKVDTAFGLQESHQKIFVLCNPTVVFVQMGLLEVVGPHPVEGYSFIKETKKRGTMHPVIFIAMLPDSSDAMVARALNAGASMTLLVGSSKDVLLATITRACETLSLITEPTMDPLTELDTRAAASAKFRLAIDTFCSTPISRERRGMQDTYSVVYMFFDLDNFKRINDRNGHGAGDRALQAFAKILKSTVRRGDIISRHGG